MDLKDGEIVEFKINDDVKRWRISKIDGNVVKIFTENSDYMQMSYCEFMKLLDNGNAKVEVPEIY